MESGGVATEGLVGLIWAFRHPPNHARTVKILMPHRDFLLPSTVVAQQLLLSA